MMTKFLSDYWKEPFHKKLPSFSDSSSKFAKVYFIWNFEKNILKILYWAFLTNNGQSQKHYLFNKILILRIVGVSVMFFIQR